MSKLSRLVEACHGQDDDIWVSFLITQVMSNDMITKLIRTYCITEWAYTLYVHHVNVINCQFDTVVQESVLVRGVGVHW